MSYLLSKGMRKIPKIPDKSHLTNLFSLDHTEKMKSKNNNLIIH